MPDSILNDSLNCKKEVCCKTKSASERDENLPMPLKGEILLLYKPNKRRYGYLLGKKWLSCILMMLMLISLFPAAAFADTTATMTMSTTPGPLTEKYITGNTNFTIDITLANNSWASGIADGSGNIINTLIPILKSGFSAATDSTQWTNLLNNPGTTFVLKTTTNPNDTIEITVSTSSSYNIYSDQVVTFNPAASLLQNSSNIPSSANFTITADPQATLSGFLASGASVSDIIAGGKQLVITLADCQWYTNSTSNTDVTTDTTKRTLLFKDLFGANSDIYNALIAVSNPGNVISLSANTGGTYNVVTITLPPVPNYNPSNPANSQTIFTNPMTLDGTLLLDSSGNAFSSPLSNIITSSTNSIIWNSTPNLTESGIDSTGGTLSIKLNGNSWISTIATDTTKQAALLNSFTIAADPAAGGTTTTADTAAWNTLKAAIKSTSFALSATTNPNDTLKITIPAVSAYNISKDQQITVTVPSTVLTNNTPIANTLSFTILANPSVTVSGSLTGGVNALDMATGNKVLTATLSNAVWQQDVISNITKREKLVDDLLYSGSSTDNWTTTFIPIIKAEAKFSLSTDAKTVTITLPALSNFNISQSITITPFSSTNLSGSLSDLQASNLASIANVSLTGAPFQNNSTTSTFTIASISSHSVTLTAVLTEPKIVAGGQTLVITLNNDSWAQDVVSSTTKLNELISNITASTNTTAWNNVQTALKNNPSDVVRTSDSVLTITLPPVSTYNLDSDQTINVTIPSDCTSTSSASFNAGSFTIKAVTAALSGTAVTDQLDSKSVIAGGKAIVITLNNATWASNVTTNLSDLLSCFTSTSSNWSKIKPAITASNITLSGSVLTIKLPPIAGFICNGTETVSWNVSSPSLIPEFINEKLGSSKTLSVSSSQHISIGDQSPIATTASLSFSPSTMNVANVASGNSNNNQIIVTLTNGTWDPTFLQSSTKIKTLVNSFTVTSDKTNWALVQTALTSASPSSVFSVSPDKSTLTIILPPVPGYDPVNTQIVSLTTIPASVLTSASANVAATGQLTINLTPMKSTESLQAALADGSLSTYISKYSLSTIRLLVPKQHLISAVSSQLTVSNTIVNSLDCYTDSSVGAVKVTVNNTTPYTSSTYTPSGNQRKFNIGFATSSTSTSTGSKTSQSSYEATISVLATAASTSPLQTDKTVKVSGSKTYKIASSTDVSGSYTLYNLLMNKSLNSSIFANYLLSDLTVEIPTT